MAKIQVAKAFTLNINGVLTRYEAGAHTVSDAVAKHSYTQHFLAKAEEPEAPPAPPAKTEAEIAEETAGVVKALVTAEKPVPNMDTVNKALKDAGLPEIKAVDRDAILATE